MQELDMSRPGSELFPESFENNNSYADVQPGHVVDDPLNMGVKQESFDVAGQAQEAMSSKEMNFEALRKEVSKMQAEREYWKGQAEAYSKQAQPQHADQSSDINKLDWDDSNDVRKAFDALRQDNERLRQEFRDQVAAIETKATHHDWNSVVTTHVPNLTATNPIFAEMIQKASNPYEAAYQLAQLNARASQVAQAKPNLNGQRAVQNAAKPKTLESVGGSSTLNAADYYASMSDADFMKIAARNLDNI